MVGETARYIIFSIPRKHWLPIFIVAAITTVVVYKFTTDTVVTISDANRTTRQPGSDEQSGPETAQPTGEAIAESKTDAEGETVANAVDEPVPDGPQEPQERMVPESLVHLLVDNLNKKDELWGKLLAKRDKQINQLTRQVSDLQGQLNEQQQQLADIRNDQVQQAWAEVDQFREQQAFGVHGRSTNFAIPEQNGLQATPTVPANQQMTEGPVVDPFVTTTSSRVTSPRTSPRRGYINVNPTGSTTSDGPTAGSAKRRIANEVQRHRAAVDWTQKYHNRSGSSRVLSEMEAGHR